MIRPLSLVPLVMFLAACASQAPRPTELLQSAAPATCPSAPTSCPACPVCPGVEPAKPAEKPLQAAEWSDLPGWNGDDLARSFDAFAASCRALEKRELWEATCAATRNADRNTLRAWFETWLRPWQLVNPDGSREGLVTGYYEPLVKGSRHRSAAFSIPVFGPPDDMITVDLSSLYPELKNLKLRGRLEGRKLVPYYSRGEWSRQENRRASSAMLWLDDPLDFFFLQIQGSGQVRLDDGSRIRIGYADQNGHPYRSIGKWLVDQGELRADQASMGGIRGWIKANPARAQELLNVNPSVVFFRELAVEGSGPPGALGVLLTPERSIAVDPRVTPLGAPVWLSTTQPLTDAPLQRLMLAQDTGGAIRGPVRADFYWGSGAEAGEAAGKMRQRGQMWVLLPKSYTPRD